MKIIYTDNSQGEEIKLIFYSLTPSSTVNDLLKAINEEGQYPQMIIRDSTEMVDGRKMLKQYGFIKDSGIYEITKTTKETNGTNNTQNYSFY